MIRQAGNLVFVAAALFLTGIDTPRGGRPAESDNPDDVAAITRNALVRLTLDANGNVEAVTLSSSTRIGPQLLSSLGRLHNVQKLAAEGVDADGVLAVAKAWPRIADVDLARAKIGDEGIRALSAMPRLRSLVLCQASRITDDSLGRLAALRGLKTLNLTYTSVTDAGLAHLSGMTGLQRLSVSHCRVGDAGMEHLKNLKELCYLDLGFTRVTSRGVAALKGLTKLQELGLAGSGATEEWLAPLKEIKDLKALGVRNASDKTPADNWEDVAALCRTPGLRVSRDHWGNVEQIAVSQRRGEKPSREWLPHLKGLKAIRRLELPYGVRDEEIANVAQLASLRCLSIDLSPVTDAGLAPIAGLTGLEGLILCDLEITDKGLARFARLTRLRTIDLRGCKRIAGPGLAHLAQISNLQRLDLVRTSVDDDALPYLAPFRRLRDLGLGETRITDAGLAHVAGLTELESLNLDRTRVTDAGLARLRGLGKLRYLNVTEGPITRGALDEFAKSMPSLVVIYVSPGPNIRTQRRF